MSWGGTSWRLASSLVLAGAVACVCLAGGEQPDLGGLVVEPGMRLAASPRGGAVLLDTVAATVTRWDEEGHLEGSCALEPSAIAAAEISRVVVHDDLALVSTNAEGGVDANGMQGFVIALDTCRVEHTLSFPSPVLSLARTRDHWVAVMVPGMVEAGLGHGNWQGCDVVLLDDEGRVVEPLDPPRGLVEWRTETGREPEGCTFGRLLTASGKHWIIPAEQYELWRPRQHGIGESFIEVPDCLVATDTNLSGDEARQETLARFENADPDVRAYLAGVLASASMASVHIPAISGCAAVGSRAAVVVHQGEAEHQGCRLDLWDLDYEALVFSDELAVERCPGFVALGDGVVWTMGEDSTVVRIELPPVLEPIEAPCDHGEEQATPETGP